jgi:hypothetical protein
MDCSERDRSLVVGPNVLDEESANSSTTHEAVGSDVSKTGHVSVRED